MNRIFSLVTIVSAMTLAACNQQSEESVADEAVAGAATEASAPVKVACAAADESGCTWYIVEQDGDWLDNDPFKSLKRSYQFIKDRLTS